MPNPTPLYRNKTYLGDGIYADVDPLGIRVFTSDGITESNDIYFGKAELLALIAFGKKHLDIGESDL